MAGADHAWVVGMMVETMTGVTRCSWNYNKKCEPREEGFGNAMGIVCGTDGYEHCMRCI